MVWLRSHEMTIGLFFQGFDEYMNLVLDDAEEIHSKTKSRKQLGKNIAGLKRIVEICIYLQY